MNMTEVRKRAKALGLNLKTDDKKQMIRAIQAAEKNPQCYDTSRTSCPESNCCWMSDCMPSKFASTATTTKQSQAPVVGKKQAGRGYARRA